MYANRGWIIDTHAALISECISAVSTSCSAGGSISSRARDLVEKLICAMERLLKSFRDSKCPMICRRLIHTTLSFTSIAHNEKISYR